MRAILVPSLFLHLCSNFKIGGGGLCGFVYEVPVHEYRVCVRTRTLVSFGRLRFSVNFGFAAKEGGGAQAPDRQVGLHV